MEVFLLGELCGAPLPVRSVFLAVSADPSLAATKTGRSGGRADIRGSAGLFRQAADRLRRPDAGVVSRAACCSMLAAGSGIFFDSLRSTAILFPQKYLHVTNIYTHFNMNYIR
jgi:hypothetical protein